MAVNKTWNEINILLNKSNKLISIDELVKKIKLPESIILKILDELNAIYVDDFVISDFYVFTTIKKINDFIHASDISSNISIEEISDEINVPVNILFVIVNSVFIDKNPRYKHILVRFPVLASRIRYVTRIEDVSKIFNLQRKFVYTVGKGLFSKENLLLHIVISLAIATITAVLTFFFIIPDSFLSLFLGVSSFFSVFSLIRSEEFSYHSDDMALVFANIAILTAAILIPCYIINLTIGLFWAILTGSILYSGLLYFVILSDSADPLEDLAIYAFLLFVFISAPIGIVYVANMFLAAFFDYSFWIAVAIAGVYYVIIIFLILFVGEEEQEMENE